MEKQLPLTHEELVQEVYNLMHKMPLEMQAALAQKVREAAEIN